MNTRKLSDLSSLTAQVALITGGGQGIGTAIALRLAEGGAAVVITDIDLNNAQRTASDITRAGGRVLGMDAKTMESSPIRSALGPYAEPDDIAKVVYFLATGMADFMTGTCATVDGGYLLI